MAQIHNWQSEKIVTKTKLVFLFFFLTESIKIEAKLHYESLAITHHTIALSI